MKSSKKVKSKQLLLSALVALVLIAGYYRWTIDESGASVPVVKETLPSDSVSEDVDNKELAAGIIEDESEEEMDYFSKAKYDRDFARSEAVSSLKEISDSDSKNEIRKDAEEKISDAAVRSEKENIIEKLVISKGFKDCVVFMDDDVLSVVVKADNLESKAVNQIKDIVLSQTDYKAAQIRISSKS